MVSPDPRFRAELESALASLDELHPLIHHASDVRQAIEATRSRRPQSRWWKWAAKCGPCRPLPRKRPWSRRKRPWRPSFDRTFSARRVGKRHAHPGHPRRREGFPAPARLQQRTGRVAPPHRSARRAGPARWAASSPSSATRAAWANRPWPSTWPAAWPCGIPERVLLIDVSLQMGVCASLLDLTARPPLTDAVRETRPARRNAAAANGQPHTSGLHLLAAPAGAVEAARDRRRGHVPRADPGPPRLRLRRRRYVSDARPRDDGRARPQRPGLRRPGKRRADAARRGQVRQAAGRPGRSPRAAADRPEPLHDAARQPEGGRRGPASGPTTSITSCPPTRTSSIAANAGEPYVLRASRFFG